MSAGELCLVHLAFLLFFFFFLLSFLQFPPWVSCLGALGIQREFILKRLGLLPVTPPFPKFPLSVPNCSNNPELLYLKPKRLWHFWSSFSHGVPQRLTWAWSGRLGVLQRKKLYKSGSYSLCFLSRVNPLQFLSAFQHSSMLSNISPPLPFWNLRCSWITSSECTFSENSPNILHPYSSLCT